MITIQNIASDLKKQAIFPMVLEEACKQWCASLEDNPDHKNGQGFTDFFYQTFENHEQEYMDLLEVSEQKRRLILNPNNVPDCPIEHVGFSTKTTNALMLYGIRTLYDLLRYSIADLKKIKGIGSKSISEMNNILNDFYHITLEQ